MRDLLSKIPFLNSIAIYFNLISPFKKFSGSENYWKHRYQSGKTSGAGSYHKLAEFKANILNEFVKDNDIKTIIEYGCGDGNQLTLSEYQSYAGFDVSPIAIAQCKKIFVDDKTKSFKLINEYTNEKAQLTLSLDVIYHLIEDEVFNAYMKLLFDSSEKFVIIYSSNTDKQLKPQAAHVKHRNFSSWIEHNSTWQLVKRIPNKYPYSGNNHDGSLADFYIYENRP